MLCFCCSQGLRDWEDDDEPWIEHARWSPRCSYLLLCKGKHFVDKACGKRNNASYMNHRVRIYHIIICKIKLNLKLISGISV